MDSFLRWWRGGSNGERRTINTTPLPQRYELYHRKRRNEGVSLIAACCIAFNLVMGSGFLALPAAVARCGLILSPITMGVVCLVMLTSLAWEAEAMARAEALEARVLRGQSSSPSLLSRVAKPALSDRTFEVCELCRIFCGKRLEMAYAGTFLLYYLATLWAYAFVFAEALSTFSPLFGHEACKHDVACTTYRKCAAAFAVLAVPLSILEPGEQITFQVFMSVMRVVIVVLMASTALLSAYGVDFGPGFGPGAATSTAPFVRFAGLGRLLPATVFAQNMGGQVPLVAREMRDRDDLNKALCAGLAGSFVLYSILAVSVAYSFGSIAKAANCQWDAFGVGIQYSALLDGIRWLVVLFPAVDVFSVYPLNVSIAADTLVTLFAGDRADRAQRQVGYRRAMRACVALPPIIGAGCMANLTAMIDTAGILVFAICCGFPPLLSVLGKNKCRAAFGDGRLDTTRYTPDGGLLWPKYAVAAFGTVAFVIAVGTPG